MPSSCFVPPSALTASSAWALLFLELVMGEIFSETHYCPCKAAGMGLVLQALVLGLWAQVTALCRMSGTWLWGLLCHARGLTWHSVLGDKAATAPLC